MQNKKNMASKICLAAGMIAVLFGVLASAVLGDWIDVAVWASMWIYQVLLYILAKDAAFWRDMTRECIKNVDDANKSAADANKSAADALDLFAKIKEKYREALRSLKESDEIMSILDKEDATIRYIRTKARMCGGCKNCVGCPLKEAGRNVSNEELNTEGCQHMRWCELYEFLHPAEAAVLILKWEEEHAKG